MRRSISAFAIATAALIASVAAPAEAVAGHCSDYVAESSFVHIRPGQSAQFTVAFLNCGTVGWLRGTATQVDLAICCPVGTTSPNATWAMNWLSTKRYATTTTDYVGPGQIGWFTYRVTAPIGAAPGSYTFAGELVLASTGQALNPQGYFHVATILPTISGTVRSAASGAAVPNIAVRADVAAGGAKAASGFTNSAGLYELVVADNVTYDVIFTPDASTGLAPQVYKGQPSTATSTGVSVSGANRTGIDASLGTAFTITGTMTNKATGAAMANVVVNVYMGASVGNCCYFITGIITGASGTYSVSVGNADYRVSFAPHPTSGLSVQWWRGTGTVSDWTLAEDMFVSGANVAGKNAALQ